ncbi:MAG: hypothetical protein DMG41_29800 [Acidobacteria bacterium]|nr:MAG: hypothetical protein DMG42_09805 [Acidobacteriota bacterium]PYT83825.1 MAG: hypothetical protein DMG41_29800 [Acidobacteriota bacterium]
MQCPLQFCRRSNGKSDEFVAQSSESEFITGHIDFLQVRDGYLQILDYKPDARKERRARVQPTIYALALARRTNLPLKSFKCAWFDAKDYFGFLPIKGVYRPEVQPAILTPPSFREVVEGHNNSSA